MGAIATAGGPIEAGAPAKPGAQEARQTPPSHGSPVPRARVRSDGAGTGPVRVAGALGVTVVLAGALLAFALRGGRLGPSGRPFWTTAAAAGAELVALGLGLAAALRLRARYERRLHAYEARYVQAQRWDAQLEALHAASLAVARENGYPAVLQTMVDLASTLAEARYGALAVFDKVGQVEEFVTHGVDEEERARIGAPPRHRGLLGRLSGTSPVQSADVRVDPAFTGIPVGHPDIRAFLGVPIRWEGELLGHLYLAGHSGQRPFSEDEKRLLTMFAAQSALAISRHRVSVDYAQAVRSAERQRIAMDLHDRALQSLYALAMQLGRARRRGLIDLTETMTVEAAQGAIERSMASIRDVLQTLDGDGDGAAGRAPDLQVTVADMAALCGLGLTWQGEGVAALSRLDPPARSQLALCLSELMTNAARHGRARTVRVRVERVETGSGTAAGAVRLDVTDDGRGTDAMAVRTGHGLAHIVQRIGTLGGEVTFHARVQPPVGHGGAAVAIVLPLRGGGMDGERSGEGGVDDGGTHSDRRRP